MEQEALNRCRLAIYSSEWAARGAVEHYQVDPSKIRVVPYGANLDTYPGPEEVRALIASRAGTECQLLFLGVNWLRKGGRKAVEITRALREMGVKATLSIAGTEPDDHEEMPSYVRQYGFICKNTPKGRNKLTDLITRSHFLLLPTIADCTPIVFAEFNSYGIPVVTTNVGGIPSVVRDQVNGILFNPDSPPEEYARSIAAIMTDKHRYMEFCLSSYQEFISRLNWNSAMEKVNKLLREI